MYRKRRERGREYPARDEARVRNVPRKRVRTEERRLAEAMVMWGSWKMEKIKERRGRRREKATTLPKTFFFFGGPSLWQTLKTRNPSRRADGRTRRERKES